MLRRSTIGAARNCFFAKNAGLGKTYNARRSRTCLAPKASPVRRLFARRDGLARLPGRFTARLARVDRHDLAATLLFATLIVLVACTFRDYAISNDEEVQQRYGELILGYYASGFADQAVFHFKNLYLYGGLFDIAAVGLEKIVPLDAYAVRHLLSALTGVGGIAAAWATARAIGGPRAGLLAALALAACGIWYGAMFNHTKDIPFAAAMIGGVYVLVRLGRELPRPRWHLVVLFGVLCGCALGIRVLGLFLFGYALLVVRDLCAGRPGRSVAASGWLCGPLRGLAGGGIPYCLRDHDRSVAVGRPGAAQSAARAVGVRRVSLSDQHDPRRPRVPDGRRSALVRAHLYRHQAHAAAARRRVSRAPAGDFFATPGERSKPARSGRRRCSSPSPRSSR